MEELLELSSSFSFDIPAMVVGLFFGVVGFYVFRHGKKTAQRRLIWIGVALMFYPYFVDGVFWNTMVGVWLSGVAYYLWPI